MSDMKQYVADVLSGIEQKDPEQKLFHDTVSEVFTSIVPVLENHPEYREQKILERMVEPERVISFRVPWQDDQGRSRSTAAIAYRCRVPLDLTKAACASIRASRSMS